PFRFERLCRLEANHEKSIRRLRPSYVGQLVIGFDRLRGAVAYGVRWRGDGLTPICPGPVARRVSRLPAGSIALGVGGVAPRGALASRPGNFCFCGLRPSLFGPARNTVIVDA